MSVCFRNAQRTFSLSSFLCITACLSVSGTHTERSVHHHLTMQHPVCLFQERTKNAKFIIISLCSILFVCFRNTQRTVSSSSSHYATSCLSVSGTHKEQSVHRHLTMQHPVCFRNAQRTVSSSSSHYAASCSSVSGTHKQQSVHHHLFMQHPGCLFQERTKNAQFIIISLRNNMFELADRLVGIYKTYNCTKSVTINPHRMQLPLQEINGAPEMPASQA